MKRVAWSVVIVAPFLILAACWNTKPNPAYCTTTCADAALDCDLELHICVPRGTAPDLSTPPDMTIVCDTNAMCTMADTPICDTVAHTCKPCQTGQCTGAAPVCFNGACVACVGEGDCAATQQICDATNKCVACKQHSDCGTGICDDGVCAKAGDITYVDNANADCATGDGTTPAKAVCQVNAGIAKGKKYVKVAGSATDYQTIVVMTAVDVVIVGPGKAATTTARFKLGGTAGAVLNPSGTATLVLDGLELVGENSPARAGALCSAAGGAATLTVRDCSIHSSGGFGIDSTGCVLRAERDIITDNHGGISLAGNSNYTVQNNLIVANPSTNSAGVVFASTSTGTFRFNTVAGNVAGAVAGGISCGSAVRPIEDSIVVGNTPVGGSQFDGACMLANVVTGADTFANAVQLTPAFVSATNFHLAGPANAANVACCVDKASSTNPPTVDVDNTRRPKGAGYDIGAHEVE